MNPHPFFLERFATTLCLTETWVPNNHCIGFVVSWPSVNIDGFHHPYPTQDLSLISEGEQIIYPPKTKLASLGDMRSVEFRFKL